MLVDNVILLPKAPQNIGIILFQVSTLDLKKRLPATKSHLLRIVEYSLVITRNKQPSVGNILISLYLVE